MQELVPNKVNQISFANKKFAVTFEPAKINFPEYDQMAQTVDQIANEYANWEVKPERIKESKAVRADLNRLKTGINRVKIDISKQADAPVTEFKRNIKVLLDKINATSSKIDQGIKQLEDKEKADRHSINIRYIAKLADVSGIDPNQIEYDSKWDLKTTRFETIDKSINQQIQILVAKQLEFEENVKAVKLQAQTLGLPESHWINELTSKSLSTVLQEMTAYKKDVAAIAKKQAETKQKEQKDLKKQGKYLVDPETGEVKEKLYDFSLEFYGVTSYQMDQLKRFIKDMGIKAGNAHTLKRR
ncbi:hypothetical protein FC52_GL000882 [Lactobacillus pasteurii DSM 23907 = CRBIP 24.76]|nr:hypothetical protein FC52_GL000882 [Lactobacillus pasteurii DSM 23907 = CRBIP 24.76]